MSTRIGKDLAVNGTTIVAQAAWNDELEHKHQKVVEWLRANHFAGVLIRRNENVAWLTGGAVELRVLTPCETGVAALLVTAEGKRYYFTTENEAPRLNDEEFGALDFEPVIFPWFADETGAAAAKLAGGPLASDTGAEAANLFPLRASLRETEIARYKWLGAQTAAATVESLQAVTPGLSEYDLEAMTAANLLRRGILPSVYLYAADDRIFKYKHAVARGKRVDRYAMLNLCARKWGLAISITRFVHFGPLPKELEARFRSAAQVNAALLDASRVGATIGGAVQSGASCVRSGGLSRRGALPSPGWADGLLGARMGGHAEGNGDRGGPAGVCVESEHSRRQGGRHCDSARWKDRMADGDAGAAGDPCQRGRQRVPGGGSAWLGSRE